MYVKTNWENLPSTNTPLNATNLNKIENELSDLESNKFIKSEKTGTIGVGSTAYSDYIQGFFGFAVIRVFASDFEYYYTGALSGINKYVKKIQTILENKHEGNPNANCQIQLFDSPDTINFHIAILNTGSVALEYKITLCNFM